MIAITAAASIATNAEPNWIEYASLSISFLVALIALAATYISYTIYVANTSPEVIVYLDGDPDEKTLINLIIKNIGNAPARNIKFEPQAPLPQNAFGFNDAQMPNEMDTGPIVNGVSFLAPNSYRLIIFGQFGGLEKWFNDKEVDITITYERANSLLLKSKKIKNVSTLDIHSFSNTSAADNSHAKKIVDALQELNKEINKISQKMQK